MAFDENAVDHRRDKASLLSKKTTKGKTLNEVVRSGIAGGIAGCVAKTSVAPLDRVKILFQAGHPDYTKYAGSFTGVFRASTQIFKETGIRGLLQGHSATLARIFPYAAIKFMAYEQFHRLLMPTKDKESGARFFLAGSCSGVISVLVTYPLDLIRVRMAIETRHSLKDRSPSFFHMAKQIWLEGEQLKLQDQQQQNKSISSSPAPSPSQGNRLFGFLNFYRGFMPSLMGMVPYAGVSFFTYGLLRTHVPRPKSVNQTVFDLTTGSLAGGCAQTASYPLEVIRRQMQKKGGLRFRETIKHIIKTSGWRGFYVGLTVGYIKVVPMNGISYATWEFMKRVLNLSTSNKKEISSNKS